MTLLCECLVFKKLQTLLEMQGKPQKSSKAKLCLGITGSKESADQGDVYLSIYKLRDPNAIKFKVSENVEKVHDKFVTTEGKATIVFRNPPSDVFIKTNNKPALQTFLSLLKKVLAGGKLDGKDRVKPTPFSTKESDSMKTRMVITTRSDYPVSAGFPSHLKSLTVGGCSLKQIDRRMLKLKSLVLLDLSDNKINSLPDDWSSAPPLQNLVLRSNNLQTLPGKMFMSTLQNTLQSLDVSDNKLTSLPKALCDLHFLSNLSVKQNELNSLPSNIHKLFSLKALNLSCNSFQALPRTLAHLRLQLLDVSQNHLSTFDSPAILANNMGVLSLFETAARVVRKHNISYGPGDVPLELVYHLDDAKLCSCMGLSFEENTRVLEPVNFGLYCAEIVKDSNQENIMYAETFICSPKCLTKWQRRFLT